MKPQTVHVWPCTARSHATYQGTDYWSLHGKAGWLSRTAWRFLHWRKALQPYLLRIDKWTFHPQAQRPLNEAILEAIERAHANPLLARSGDIAVIIGAKTFKELAASPVFHECVTFRIGPFGGPNGREVYGVPLHVVPGMEGIAVVPCVLIEKVKQCA